MPKYRRKPGEPIEAFQWKGGDVANINNPNMLLIMSESPPFGLLWVEKSNAWCQILIGSWIVPEPDGKGFYPVTEELFEKTYEEVKE